MKYKRFGLFYGLLKVMVPISFFYFYKKIKIIKLHKIPQRIPIIFSSNHTNTLIDPFVIGIFSGRLTGFLARASAFKNPMAAKILKSLKIMPVYRPRDGMENLIKNDEVFKASFEVLSSKQSFVMFPEGSHDRTRHLRLFKKGFARIALGAVEESKNTLKVKIYPTGINYSDHLYQGGDLLVIFGKPIEVSDYFELYKQNEAKAVNELKKEVHLKIKELIINIEDLEHYELIDSLREIYSPEMLKKQTLNRNTLFNEFKADKKTIEILEKYAKDHKEETKLLDNRVKDYKESLNKLKIKENILVKNNNFFIAVMKSLFLMILSPVFIFSLANSFIPYLFLRNNINNKIKDDHFYSAYKMAIGMFLYPVFYLIITIPVFIIYGFKFGIIYYLSLFVTAKIALYTRQLFRNTKLGWNFLIIKFLKKEVYQKLNAQRKEIIKLTDEIVETYKSLF